MAVIAGDTTRRGWSDVWPVDAPFHNADYVDAYSAPSPHALSHSPVAWARYVLEGAPLPMRVFLRMGWRFGLRFPPARGEAVLDWPIVAESADWVLLQQQSWLFGVALLMHVSDGRLTWATRVKFTSPLGRATWWVVGVIHRRFAPRALRRAVAHAK